MKFFSLKNIATEFTAGMKIACVLIPLMIFMVISSCGKSELDLKKEEIMKQAGELKAKIDSTQKKIDSAQKDFDSLKRIIIRDSLSVDSVMKKIIPIK